MYGPVLVKLNIRQILPLLAENCQPGSILFKSENTYLPTYTIYLAIFPESEISEIKVLIVIDWLLAAVKQLYKSHCL